MRMNAESHRDIKPDDVLLSGGAAVVTDVGIAKAISASHTPVAVGVAELFPRAERSYQCFKIATSI
jgi:serine/threonine protein kinase